MLPFVLFSAAIVCYCCDVLLLFDIWLTRCALFCVLVATDCSCLCYLIGCCSLDIVDRFVVIVAVGVVECCTCVLLFLVCYIMI